MRIVKNSLLVSIMMMAILLCCSSQVQAAQDGDYTYTVTAGETQITKYTGVGGTVTIPSALGGAPVTSIGAYAFSNCNSLTSITIQQGVTSIGEDAFGGCRFLTSISLPQGLKSIGKRAFASCYGVTSLSIPEEVTSIGPNAFYEWRGITSLNIPIGVTSISDNAFSVCTGLTSISMPGVKSIGYQSFSYCTSLKTIDLPQGVESIGDYAFIQCTSLTSVSMPGVKSISQGAFSRCEVLTTITLPESVTTIGSGAFSSCYSLTSISIPQKVTKIDGYVFASCSGLKTISIPPGVTSIGAQAFMGCTGLTSIDIPELVTSIGFSAFKDCSSLTSISIPPGVTIIDDSTFYGCTGLSSFCIPEKVTSIGICSFMNCTGLTSINIPEKVTRIDMLAFSGCTGLTSIIIPLGVKSIDYGAFSHCSGLTTIRFNSATITIDDAEYTIPVPTKIIGCAPSTAKTYAAKYSRTFEVINSLQSIAITTPATKLSYTVGDTLDITGLLITGTYSDGSTTPESITAANITGFNSITVVVDQVLTITVGEKTATYKVQIAQSTPPPPTPTLQSIAITTVATKLSYTVGETLDISGLVVTGTYSDNSTTVEAITAVNITGFDSATAVVDQVLTITISGKTTTYKVQIVAAIVNPDFTGVPIVQIGVNLNYSDSIGLFVGLDNIKDSSGNSINDPNVAEYQIEVDYDPASITIPNVLDETNSGQFTWTIDEPGKVTVAYTSETGIASFNKLFFIPITLTGSALDAASLQVRYLSVTDPTHNQISVESPAALVFQRGKISNEGSGTEPSTNDAVAGLQYLAGLINAGVDVDQVNLINMASIVGPDTGSTIVKPNVKDIIALMQYLVGLRDPYFKTVDNSSGDILIGGNLELTGNLSMFGQTAKNAIELAFQQVNDQGGILNGRKFKLITEDNKSVINEVLTAATKLITQDKVVGIIGPMTSPGTKAEIPIATQNNLPIITPSGSAPELTVNEDDELNKWIFRACYIDPVQANAAAQFALADEINAQNAAVIIDQNSAYSQGLATAFVQAFTNGGGQIIEQKQYAAGSVDYSAILANIKEANPDVVYLPGYYQEAGKIVKQARDLGMAMPFIGGDGWADAEIYNIAGVQAMNNTYYTDHVALDDPAIAQFITDYQAKYGEKPNAFSALAFDAAKMYVKAIEIAGNTDTEKIRVALENLKDLQGVSGNITVDPTTHNPIKNVIVMENKEGKAIFLTKIDPNYTGSKISWSLGGDPPTLDPALTTDLSSANVQTALFEGLTRIGPGETVLPGIAESWTVSEDGKVLTFKLRDAKWSNGDPITAEDFKYSWLRALSPELASDYAYQLFYIKGAEDYNSQKGTVDAVGIKVVDTKTLEVTLAAPTPYFIALTSFHTLYPVNKNAVVADPNWANKAETLVSNGPFKVIEWLPNDQIVVGKNDQYWDVDSVKLSVIDFELNENADSALASFDSGLIDGCENVPAGDIDRLKATGVLKTAPYIATYFYRFNVTEAPFDNPKVRMALTLAIDRQQLIDQVLKGGQTPAFAFAPSGLVDIVAGEDFRTVGGDLINEDITDAKALLADAGYPDGINWPTDVSILYNTSSNHQRIAEAIQSMWKTNLGIDVQLRNEDWPVYLESQKNLNYSISRAGWIADYYDAMTFMDMFVSGGGNNLTGWENLEYDRLIKDVAKQSGNQVVRIPAMHAAERILMDEMPVLPLYFYVTNYIIKDYVKGEFRSSFGNIDFKNAYRTPIATTPPGGGGGSGGASAPSKTVNL